jgi:hypothetical protein
MAIEDDLRYLPLRALAKLCAKIAEESSFQSEVRTKARQFETDVALLPQHYQKKTSEEHAEEERLHRQMVQFIAAYLR